MCKLHDPAIWHACLTSWKTWTKKWIRLIINVFIYDRTCLAKAIITPRLITTGVAASKIPWKSTLAIIVLLDEAFLLTSLVKRQVKIIAVRKAHYTLNSIQRKYDESGKILIGFNKKAG